LGCCATALGDASARSSSSAQTQGDKSGLIG
jgi:hypothetical protein